MWFILLMHSVIIYILQLMFLRIWSVSVEYSQYPFNAVLHLPLLAARIMCSLPNSFFVINKPQHHQETVGQVEIFNTPTLGEDFGCQHTGTGPTWYSAVDLQSSCVVWYLTWSVMWNFFLYWPPCQEALKILGKILWMRNLYRQFLSLHLE